MDAKMNAVNVYKVDVKVKVNGRTIQFFIYTNVPDYDIPLVWFFEDWAEKTHSFTPKSFCKFIMRQHEEFVALTKPQFDRMLQATNN